jgi:hypothetical protein
LIVHAGKHVALHRQVRQELHDSGRAQVARMALVVQQDEDPHPGDKLRCVRCDTPRCRVACASWSSRRGGFGAMSCGLG